MWVITHTVSGMALGATLEDLGPWLVVPGALLLHLLLDLVPHWDYTRTPNAVRWGAIDLAASGAALLAAYALLDAGWLVLLAGAVSALPDLDVFNALLPTERRVRLFPSHWSRFPHGRAEPVPGTALQAVVVALSLLLLLR